MRWCLPHGPFTRTDLRRLPTLCNDEQDTSGADDASNGVSLLTWIARFPEAVLRIFFLMNVHFLQERSVAAYSPIQSLVAAGVRFVFIDMIPLFSGVAAKHLWLSKGLWSVVLHAAV